MPIRAVVFDVGKTSIDETRIWASRAHWFGVPHLTLFGVLGGPIARGEDHRKLFGIMRPGSTFRQEREARAAAGKHFWPDKSDLYPDAAPCLATLRTAGYRLGIAGNQPDKTEPVLNEKGLDVHMVASPHRWGVEKPSPGFVDRVVEETGVPADEIAYVGDRIDNDVIPAVRAGMIGVFFRRGPWGHLHADLPEAAQAHVRLDSLADLPATLAALNNVPPLSTDKESQP